MAKRMSITMLAVLYSTCCAAFGSNQENISQASGYAHWKLLIAGPAPESNGYLYEIQLFQATSRIGNIGNITSDCEEGRDRAHEAFDGDARSGWQTCYHRDMNLMIGRGVTFELAEPAVITTIKTYQWWRKGDYTIPNFDLFASKDGLSWTKFGEVRGLGSDWSEKQVVRKEWAPCSNEEFEVQAPTFTSDRVCKPWTICTQSQYEVVQPTATHDRSCKALTPCSDEEFEVQAPTFTSDRVCKPWTICTKSQYEVVQPTATHDRSCKALTECADNEVEKEAPTATSDRQCRLSKEARHHADGPGTCWFLKDRKGESVDKPISVNNKWSFAAIVGKSQSLARGRCVGFRGRSKRGKAKLLCGSANGENYEACASGACLDKCEELSQSGCCQFISADIGDARRLRGAFPGDEDDEDDDDEVTLV